MDIIEFIELLSPRIRKHCIHLYDDGYYKHAAHEAMTQVELALKEKVQTKDIRFGKKLVDDLLGTNSEKTTIKLRLPLGDTLQKHAKTLFEGAFMYYRNYTAHDGAEIDEKSCIRIMVLASELLEMIDASSLNYADLGGIDGLLKSGVFSSEKQLHGMLKMLDQYHLPDGDGSGLFEKLFYEFGIGDEQIEAVIELDFVRYTEVEYVQDLEELKSAWQTSNPPQTMGWFELTDLGEKIIGELEKRSDKLA
jgi:uncharacterized protein (TIGR02391 family)